MKSSRPERLPLEIRRKAQARYLKGNTKKRPYSQYSSKDIMQTEFEFEEGFRLTEGMKASYAEQGYFIIKGFLDKGEITRVTRTLEGPNGMLEQHCNTTVHPDGTKIRRITYTHPGNDVSGMINRSAKVVDTCEEAVLVLLEIDDGLGKCSLLGGEVYHYHSKFMLKDAGTGGQHFWHQDYGYWYDNGNLFPDMITVWIALDRATRQNSCLQVLAGSHKCGRIEHNIDKETKQKTADIERVEALKTVCPLVYCEMKAGDALFLHCNLLHASSPNTSDMRRWAFIPTYNKARNNPTKEHHHASYNPLHKVSNDAIKECSNYTDFSGKIFIG